MKITPKLRKLSQLAAEDGYEAMYTTYSKNRWQVGYIFYSLPELVRISGEGMSQIIGYHALFRKYNSKERAS